MSSWAGRKKAPCQGYPKRWCKGCWSPSCPKCIRPTQCSRGILGRRSPEPRDHWVNVLPLVEFIFFLISEFTRSRIFMLILPTTFRLCRFDLTEGYFYLDLNQNFLCDLWVQLGQTGIVKQRSEQTCSNQDTLIYTCH